MRHIYILFFCIALFPKSSNSQIDFIRDTTFNPPKDCIGPVQGMVMTGESSIYLSHGRMFCSNLARFARLNIQDGSVYPDFDFFTDVFLAFPTSLHYIAPYVYGGDLAEPLRMTLNGTLDTLWAPPLYRTLTGHFKKYVYIEEYENILIGGTIFPYDYGTETPPVRYYRARPFLLIHEDGQIDSSFTSPIIHYHPNIDSLNHHINGINDLIFDEENRVIYFTTPGNYANGHFSAGVFKMNVFGQIDTTYSHNFDDVYWKRYTSLYPVALQSDGKLIVRGSIEAMHEGKSVFATMIRLNTDGSFDPTFNYYNNFMPEITVDEYLTGNHYAGEAHGMYPWKDDMYILTGDYNLYQGKSRGNIAVVDKDGFLIDSFFRQEGFDSNQPHLLEWSNTRDLIFMGEDTILIGGRWNYYNNERYDEGVIKLVLGEISTSTAEMSSLNLNPAIYPNPASHEISIDLASSIAPHASVYQLVIRDLQGRDIGSYPISGTMSTFRIDHLQNGMYIAHVYDAQRLVGTSKFIVHK